MSNSPRTPDRNATVALFSSGSLSAKTKRETEAFGWDLPKGHPIQLIGVRGDAYMEAKAIPPDTHQEFTFPIDIEDVEIESGSMNTLKEKTLAACNSTFCQLPIAMQRLKFLNA
jgi:hypothetical protein